MKINRPRSPVAPTTKQRRPGGEQPRDRFVPSQSPGRTVACYLAGGLLLGLAATKGQGAGSRAAMALLGGSVGAMASDPLSIPFNALGAGDGVNKPRMILGSVVGAAVAVLRGSSSTLGGLGLGLAAGLCAFTTHQAIAQMGFAGDRLY